MLTTIHLSALGARRREYFRSYARCRLDSVLRLLRGSSLLFAQSSLCVVACLIRRREARRLFPTS
jgi:hypothetical protein